MSTYDPLSRLSYHDYLQAKSLVGDVTFEVSAQGRALIASQQQLERNAITVCETLKTEVGAAIEILSYTANETAEAIRELNATFRWEFSQLLAVTGRMADSLEELLETAKTPAQTWAYEQYEIARDAVRRDLYEEALEATERAINGFGTQTGYKLDYRFHALLGTIRLGNVRNTSDAILSLSGAERAFLAAAKYARTDYAAEAARALVGAGYAAYCQRNVDDARRWTAQAISLNPRLAEAHFQQGKLNSHVGDARAAIADLRTAISLDPLYVVRALDDGDYQKHASDVTAMLDTIRSDAQLAVQVDLAEAEPLYGSLEGCSFGDHAFARNIGKNSAKDALTDAFEAFKRGSYMDYLEAACHLKRFRSELNSVRQQFLQQIENSLSGELRGLQGNLSAVRSSQLPHHQRVLRKWGSIVSVLLSFVINSGHLAFIFLLVIPAGLWIWPLYSRHVAEQAIQSDINQLERLRQDFSEFRSSLVESTSLP